MKKLRKTMANALELPKEVVYDLPLISMIGKEELNIENYKGIIEYSEDIMRISSASGIIKITGKKLFLKKITSENILIGGIISKLEYLL